MCIRDRVDHVRGRGLLRGVVLTAPVAKDVEAAARDAGFLVNAAAPDVVRLCLLYTSDAADERSSVDLGGRRIIKKKNNKSYRQQAT